MIVIWLWKSDFWVIQCEVHIWQCIMNSNCGCRKDWINLTSEQIVNGRIKCVSLICYILFKILIIVIFLLRLSKLNKSHQNLFSFKLTQKLHIDVILIPGSNKCYVVSCTKWVFIVYSASWSIGYYYLLIMLALPSKSELVQWTLKPCWYFRNVSFRVEMRQIFYCNMTLVIIIINVLHS